MDTNAIALVIVLSVIYTALVVGLGYQFWKTIKDDAVVSGGVAAAVTVAMAVTENVVVGSGLVAASSLTYFVLLFIVVLALFKTTGAKKMIGDAFGNTRRLFIKDRS